MDKRTADVQRAAFRSSSGSRGSQRFHPACLARESFACWTLGRRAGPAKLVSAVEMEKNRMLPSSFLGLQCHFPASLGADGDPDDRRGAFRLIARLFWNGVSELAQPLGPLLLTYCILRWTDRPRHWDPDRDARLSRVSSMTMTLAGREKEKEQIPRSVIRPLALSNYATFFPPRS